MSGISVSDVLWEVVGGADTGGIIARMDVETASAVLEPRLAFGSVLREWELEGNRLQYELISGTGPQTGWISIKVKNKDLVVKYDKSRAIQQPLGSVLPPLPRKKSCPGGLVLPNEGQRNIARRWGLDKARKPQCYVLAFPGAEDEVINGWLRLECEAPPEVEVGVYEWPGHGGRGDEPFAKTLTELVDDAFETFRDAALVGNFAVLGHSIGALIMTGVCERFQRELRRRPILAYSLDRGAPHLMTLTEDVRKLLATDPVRYMEIADPMKKPDSKAYRMRMADQPFDDHVFPIGFYKFQCPVHVFIASSLLGPQDAGATAEAHGDDDTTVPEVQGDADPTVAAESGEDAKAVPEEVREDSAAAAGANDESLNFIPYLSNWFRSGTSRPWTEEDGELWSKWGDDVSMHPVDLSHMELRLSDTIYNRLYGEIQRTVSQAASQAVSNSVYGLRGVK
mmetsp:Transcript_19644/g.35740  ORF Transcript_19644/g.35740 Transcript_19644/m.35740 type:complete len:453 (-) Transcript_19644:29-1387(-)